MSYMYFKNMSLSSPGSFPLRADGHCDTILAMQRGKHLHINFETMPRYVDMQFMALFIEEESDNQKAKAEYESLYQYYRTLQTEDYYDLLIPLKNGDSFHRLEPENTGVVLAMENCAPLGCDEDDLFEAYERGIRSFGIVWNGSNCFGGGAYSESGLTPAGERFLRNLNRLPVAVDLAHMNERTFYDSLEILEHPPIVSHSCCYGLTPHCRNLKESQMKELRMADGVMGITFVDAFLSDNKEDATIDRIIDHILYASDFMGIDKVALGSDFDGADMPMDMEKQSCLPLLYKKMKQRGFTDGDIKMVAGENLFRYMYATLSREEI